MNQYSRSASVRAPRARRGLRIYQRAELSPAAGQRACDAAGGSETRLLSARLRGDNEGSGGDPARTWRRCTPAGRRAAARPRERAGQGDATRRLRVQLPQGDPSQPPGGARLSATERMNESERRANEAKTEQDRTTNENWTTESKNGEEEDGNRNYGAEQAENNNNDYAGTADAGRADGGKPGQTQPRRPADLDVDNSYHAAIAARRSELDNETDHRGTRRRAGQRRTERRLRAGETAPGGSCERRLAAWRPGSQPGRWCAALTSPRWRTSRARSAPGPDRAERASARRHTACPATGRGKTTTSGGATRLRPIGQVGKRACRCGTHPAPGNRRSVGPARRAGPLATS